MTWRWLKEVFSDGTSDVVRWMRGVCLAGVAGAALLIMGEVDSLLRTLETAGKSTYGMSALTGLRFSQGSELEAATLWRSAAGADPFWWVAAHAFADMFFAVIYGVALILVVRKVTDFAAPPLPRFVRLLRGAAIAVPVVDVAENLATLSFAYTAGTGKTLFGYVFVFSIIKWGLLIGVLLGIGFAWIKRQQADRAGGKDGPRILWLFRVQVVIVAILAFAVAVPSRNRLGALQQLPDVLRSYADRETGGRVPWLILSGVALLSLAAAVWISGHWLQIVIPDSDGPRAPARYELAYRVLALAAIGWLIFAVLGFVGLRQDQPPWVTGVQMFIASILLVVVLGLIFYAHYYSAREMPWKRRPLEDRHRRTIQVLTALIFTVGGLGLVRAFTGPLLLMLVRDDLNPLEQKDLKGVTFWFVVGLVTAIGIAPLALLGLSVLEAARAKVEPQLRRYHWVLPVLSVAVLMVAGLTTWVLGQWPERFGPWLGANGAIAVALAVGCLFAGAIVAIGQRSSPWLWFAGTKDTPAKYIALPGLAILVLIFATVGMADPVGTYHRARVEPAATQPAPRSLATHFSAWEQATQDCVVEVSPTKRIRPMVLVAAAGGGIRAAYWTERALMALTASDGTQDERAHCRRDGIFLVSSVSGGSVGTALWSLRDSGTPATAIPLADKLSSTRALASVGTAWLFRDLPRSFTGIDPGWPDRAAVMENSWKADVPSLSRKLLTADAGWRPLLMLNGTDMATGCRVVIGLLVPPATNEPLPRSCDDTQAAGRDLPAAHYASDYLEGAECTNSAGDLSLATAALLSARFPFVTPTGLMYACNDDKTKISLIQIGDGGYLDNSGIQGALQSWDVLQLEVDKHNEQEPTDPEIVPILVVIGNGYRSTAQVPVPGQQRELIAPLAGLGIPKAYLSGERLEAEARTEFTGSPLPEEDPLSTRCGSVLVIAPKTRPEISAPLGWSLSQFTRRSMDAQLTDQDADLNCVRSLLRGVKPS